MRPSESVPSRRGSVLVEFAVIALVLYLLLAATIEFGRVMYSAQAAQTAADAGARELAKTPLPAGMDFQTALMQPDVSTRVYSPDFLVVELDLVPGGDLNALFALAPVVNQQLRPLMIVDQPAGSPRLLRYPGRLKTHAGPFPNAATNPNHLTVDVPLLAVGGSGGITFVDVVEEVKPAGQVAGPFSVTAEVPAGQEGQRGLVALRVNYPCQAAALASYPEDPSSPFDPSPTNNALNPNPVLDGDGRIGPNAGSLGLGRLEAVGKQVRPYRKVITGQAFARREIFQ